MKAVENLKLENHIELWKHKDDEPYNEGELIYDGKNTTYPELTKYMLNRMAFSMYPTIPGIGGGAALGAGIADWIDFKDSVGMTFKKKAIRKNRIRLFFIII